MPLSQHKEVLGSVIGFGSFTVHTFVEKIMDGFDFAHYKQEVLEDATGAFISVTVGFFLMKIYKSLFKDKKDEN